MYYLSLSVLIRVCVVLCAFVLPMLNAMRALLSSTHRRARSRSFAQINSWIYYTEKKKFIHNRYQNINFVVFSYSRTHTLICTIDWRTPHAACVQANKQASKKWAIRWRAHGLGAHCTNIRYTRCAHIYACSCCIVVQLHACIQQQFTTNHTIHCWNNS